MTSQSDGNDNPGRRLWEASNFYEVRQLLVMRELQPDLATQEERSHVAHFVQRIPIISEARIALMQYRRHRHIGMSAEQKRIHTNAIKLKSKRKMRAIRAAEATQNAASN